MISTDIIGIGKLKWNNSLLQPRDISAVFIRLKRIRHLFLSNRPTSYSSIHSFYCWLLASWTSFQPYTLDLFSALQFISIVLDFFSALQLQRFPIISHLKILPYLLHTIVCLSEYEVKNHHSPLIIHKSNQYA